MNQFFLFYREIDYQYFLFNGEWPINISPDGKAFGHYRDDDSTDQIITNTTIQLPVLKEILNSRKKVFYINSRRYIITHRDKFVIE